jgi:hypothetical protein
MCVCLCCNVTLSVSASASSFANTQTVLERTWIRSWVLMRHETTLLTRPLLQFTGLDIALPNLWTRGPTILTEVLFAYIEASVLKRAGSKVEQETKAHSQPACSNLLIFCVRPLLSVITNCSWAADFNSLSCSSAYYPASLSTHHCWRIVSACNQPHILVVQHTQPRFVTRLSWAS